MRIPFNKPTLVADELSNIANAVSLGQLSGDGFYTKECHKFLEFFLGSKKALLTHSCTAALEMCALLLNLQDGDEIILPSYTFVSTANAFVLRGAVPVFVDIRPDTLNIDENLIEKAITSRTKAICVVHYAGVACEMDKIMEIARKFGLVVVEDAAQALGSYYKGKPLGSLGDLACFSFHETKNIISGEGGALIINDAAYIERAEIIREKGTNRARFFRDEVDKYTWVDIGSSYLPSEILSAFLFAQLNQLEQINRERLASWNYYNDQFQEFKNKVRLPFLPSFCQHNAHMYYLIFKASELRTKFIKFMQRQDIKTIFHYVPLHSSPAGIQYGRTSGSMDVTDRISSTLVRLPLYIGLQAQELEKIVNFTHDFIREKF